MTQERKLSEVFMKIAELAGALGQVPINREPGCWEIQLGNSPDIRIAVNGHPETCKDSVGRDVLPFTAQADWNGWPFAIFDPYGGHLLQSPSRKPGSSERLLTMRLTRAIREARAARV